jgi:hypothetical protein
MSVLSTSQSYHLAQFNTAIMRAPLSDPSMAEFVAQLDTVNAIADATPGFIWRLKDTGGNATNYRPYNNDRILINLSVWESIEALSGYVYRSQHGKVMRDRRQWFEKADQPNLVLWWISAGSLPTVAEGQQRLEVLQQQGTTAEAFSFSQPFPAPVMNNVATERMIQES